MADIFSKWNEVSLSLQGKQLTELVANDIMQTFTQKLKLRKILPATMCLTASQCSIFLRRIEGTLLNVVFNIYEMCQ